MFKSQGTHSILTDILHFCFPLTFETNKIAIILRICNINMSDGNRHIIKYTIYLIIVFVIRAMYDLDIRKIEKKTTKTNSKHRKSETIFKSKQISITVVITPHDTLRVLTCCVCRVHGSSIFFIPLLVPQHFYSRMLFIHLY